MARSKFYGYTTVDTPIYKRWSLAELPLSTTSVFTSPTTSTVGQGSAIPFTGTMINQAGITFNNSADTFTLPGGFYKVSYRVNATTAAAAAITITLTGTPGTIATENGATSVTSLTTTINGEVYLVVPMTGITIGLVNTGGAIMTGTDTQIAITRIL